MNRSRIATAVCVPLTSNLLWADAPGNALLASRETGLQKDSGANASQLIAIDRDYLVERAGRVSPKHVEQILHGIDIILGR